MGYLCMCTHHIYVGQRRMEEGGAGRDLGDSLHVYQNIVNKFKNEYDDFSVKIGKMILGTPEFSHRY